MGFLCEKHSISHILHQEPPAPASESLKSPQRLQTKLPTLRPGFGTVFRGREQFWIFGQLLCLFGGCKGGGRGRSRGGCHQRGPGGRVGEEGQQEEQVIIALHPEYNLTLKNITSFARSRKRHRDRRRRRRRRAEEASSANRGFVVESPLSTRLE